MRIDREQVTNLTETLNDKARRTEAQKPSKVAITAIMRKLIILANALVKNDRMWVNNRA